MRFKLFKCTDWNKEADREETIYCAAVRLHTFGSLQAPTCSLLNANNEMSPFRTLWHWHETKEDAVEKTKRCVEEYMSVSRKYPKYTSEDIKVDINPTVKKTSEED